MTDDLVLELQHVTSGYHTGGLLFKCTGARSWAWWVSPAPASPP